MNQKPKKSLAEMLEKRDILGLIELYKEKAIDPADELLILKSYEIPIILHYAKFHPFKEENITAILNKETPANVIEEIIKITVYDFSDKQQQLLIEIKNPSLINCYFTRFKNFSNKVLINAIRKKDNRFLKEYINLHYLSAEAQKELIYSRNVEMILLYCDRHGFYKEVQKEFLTYLDAKTSTSIH